MTRLASLITASAAAAVLMLGVAAHAQQKAPAEKEPAKKEAVKKEKVKKAATTSVCKGLTEADCGAKSEECRWITPKKGKQKPYCRLKGKEFKKKAAPAKETK